MSSPKPIAIIGAMPQEIASLVAALENPTEQNVFGIHMHAGLLNNTPVVVVQSGIGKVNASLATSVVIQQYSPRAVINTGSAGGIGSGLAVGDVVIGSELAHHDVDVTAFGYEIGQMAQMPETYASDERLISAAQNNMLVPEGGSVHHGLIVSGDQFVASSDAFTRIRNNFPAARAVEMEASAIAQTCYRCDVPFVVIRAISDLADEQANISFDEFIIEAGKRSAHMVMAMVSEVGEL